MCGRKEGGREESERKLGSVRKVKKRMGDWGDEGGEERDMGKGKNEYE